jgi:DNA-directed RNA polymerase specialized sigma24 family protein
MTPRARIADEEYRRCNPLLDQFIARRFKDMSKADRDDVGGDAWEALWRRRQKRGDEGYETPIFFLERVAFRLSLNLRRNQAGRQTYATDPASELFSEIEGGDVVEEAIASIEDERCLSILAALSDEEKAVLLCRVCFDLDPRATQAVLGMTEKRYELVHGRALDEACNLYATQLGGPVFERHRRALLGDLESGEVNAWRLMRAAKLAALGDQDLARAVAHAA